MIIDPNAPAFPVVHAIVPQPGSYTATPPAQPGMPIRLEIASRLMAPLWGTSACEVTVARRALKLADALIETYNESQPT